MPAILALFSVEEIMAAKIIIQRQCPELGLTGHQMMV
jgi:hypothetical protein